MYFWQVSKTLLQIKIGLDIPEIFKEIRCKATLSDLKVLCSKKIMVTQKHVYHYWDMYIALSY